MKTRLLLLLMVIGPVVLLVASEDAPADKLKRFIESTPPVESMGCIEVIPREMNPILFPKDKVKGSLVRLQDYDYVWIKSDTNDLINATIGQFTAKEAGGKYGYDNWLLTSTEIGEIRGLTFWSDTNNSATGDIWPVMQGWVVRSRCVSIKTAGMMDIIDPSFKWEGDHFDMMLNHRRFKDTPYYGTRLVGDIYRDDQGRCNKAIVRKIFKEPISPGGRREGIWEIHYEYDKHHPLSLDYFPNVARRYYRDASTGNLSTMEYFIFTHINVAPQRMPAEMFSTNIFAHGISNLHRKTTFINNEEYRSYSP